MTNINDYISKVLQLTNNERKKYGLKELTIDGALNSISAIRAKEIVISFSHTRPNGNGFWTVFNDQGVDYHIAAENLAMRQPSPEDVVEAWMNSKGHRANILNGDFKFIGIGVELDGNGKFYWTQHFKN